MMWNGNRGLRYPVLKKGGSFLGQLAMLLWASCRCTCPEMLRAEVGLPCRWCTRREQWAESGRREAPKSSQTFCRGPVPALARRCFPKATSKFPPYRSLKILRLGCSTLQQLTCHPQPHSFLHLLLLLLSLPLRRF
jgi:hypothetical protein